MARAKEQKPLIIFDLVATLTDAGPRYARAFKEVCEEQGFVPPSEEQILNDLGNKNLRQIMDRHIGAMPEERQKQFMDKCNACCDAKLYDVHWHERLFPNVRNTLKQLKAAGYVLGVYTGTREDALAAQFRYHNITGYFDPRFMRAKNNDRDGFKESVHLKSEQLKSMVTTYANDYGSASGTVIVIGDSKADQEAAQQQGLRFIGFASNQSKKTALENAGVAVVFADFADLPALLEIEAKTFLKPSARRAPRP